MPQLQCPFHGCRWHREVSRKAQLVITNAVERKKGKIHSPLSISLTGSHSRFCGDKGAFQMFTGAVRGTHQACGN